MAKALIRLFMTAALTLAFMLSVFHARALDLYTYDLDSLVSMSSKIVEGRIVGEHQQDNYKVWEVEVLNSPTGGFVIGQKIAVIELYWYRVAVNDPWKLRNIGANDEIFLFLNRAYSTEEYKIPANAEIYWPVASGVRFISQGKTVGFRQRNNPGPYEAILAGVETNSAIPEVAEFWRQILESAKRVEQWNKLLARKAVSSDIPALLTLMRERNSHGPLDFGERDDITETVCSHLADLGEPEAILEASSLLKEISFEESITLGKALATTNGRNLLVAKIAENSEPIGDRLKWAGLLFQATYMGTSASFYKPVAQINQASVNEHYLTCIAELATNEQTDMAVRLQLLNSLAQMADIWSGVKVFTIDDGKEAEAIVESFSKQTDVQQFKYLADSISCGVSWNEGRSDFEPVVSLLKYASYQPQEKTMVYGLEYKSLRAGSWTEKLVVQSVKNGARLEFAIGQIKGLSGGSDTETISVPSGILPGRYRVFVEFFDGAKLEATSRYCEMDL